MTEIRPPGPEQESPASPASDNGAESTLKSGDMDTTSSNPASQEFCWELHATIHDMPRTAIFWNPFGQVVIRQPGPDHDDDDVWIRITPSYLPEIIKKLQRMLDGEE